MTELHKVVRRVSRNPFGHYRKQIVVILEPVDTIAMRLKGTRTIFRAPLSSVYRQLVEWHADAERKRKRDEQKLRRVA